MATILRMDGTEEAMAVDKKGHLSLAEAQKAVGGWVELVRLGKGDGFLVNEEGLLQQLPLNPKASEMAGRYIVGNVVLVTRGEGWL